MPPDHVQVRKDKKHEDEVRVLRQSLVTDFGETEYLLRYQKDVLDTASRFRKQTVRFPVFFGELFVFRSSCLGQVQRIGSLPFDLFRLPHVGRVAEDGAFPPVQELLHHTRIMDIGGRGDEAVDRLALPVHSCVDLHPDGVLVPLLRGVHIGIPLLLSILGGGRGVDDGGVHDGSFRESQPLLLEMGVDLLKNAFSQAVGFEKMTEFADGSLVGNGFVPEVDSDEAPH